MTEGTRRAGRLRTARGSFAAASNAQACAPTRHAPRAVGDTATTTIDSRGAGADDDDDDDASPSTTFAVIARRRARARSTVGATSARIASSVAGSSGRARERGRVVVAERREHETQPLHVCVPSRQTRVVVRRPRGGVHAARGPLRQPRGRGRGNGGGGDAGTSTPSTTTTAPPAGAPDAPVIARGACGQSARASFCDRGSALFPVSGAKSPPEDFSQRRRFADLDACGKYLTMHFDARLPRASLHHRTPSPRLRCTRPPPTRSPRRPPRPRDSPPPATGAPRPGPPRRRFSFPCLRSRQKALSLLPRDRRLGVARHAARVRYDMAPVDFTATQKAPFRSATALKGDDSSRPPAAPDPLRRRFRGVGRGRRGGDSFIVARR